MPRRDDLEQLGTAVAALPVVRELSLEPDLPKALPRSLAEARQACLPLPSRQGRSPYFWLEGLIEQGQLEAVSPRQALGSPGPGAPWRLLKFPQLHQTFGNWQIQGYLFVTVHGPAPVAGPTPSVTGPCSLSASLLPIWQADAASPGWASEEFWGGAGVPLALATALPPALQLFADSSFVEQLGAVQSLFSRSAIHWEIALAEYGQLHRQSLLPSQALQYFDALLSLSPLPPSSTPASDRLFQRRHLLQRFAALSTLGGHSLWSAYCALQGWIGQQMAMAAQTQRPAAEPGLETWLQANQWRKAAHDQALSWVASFEQQPTSQRSDDSAQRAFSNSRALQERLLQLEIHPPLENHSLPSEAAVLVSSS